MMKIAIDGPAGAGKSTVARELARELGFIYIDTGAMYRALTWKALQEGIDLEDPKALYELAVNTDIHFTFNSTEQKVMCDDVDITFLIRSPEVSSVVSKVASCPDIRRVMVRRQQEMAANISVVMDGRDIGEYVLPDAEYKFFLTANLDERIRRRKKERAEQGFEVDDEAIKNEIIERDRNDTQREVGALKVLNDSIVIDTSNLSVKEVVNRMLSIIREA
ncbi:MAG: (d)CMP kinase [Syntrophomonadaceae bacterium]|nr:(d)CMP kinase [Syntrophomonadaceae bacterium]